MNVDLENVNLKSSSGPNHFASKLIKQFETLGVSANERIKPDIRLCFIESHKYNSDGVPLVQRLDGIYFNTAQNYKLQNSNIEKTYRISDGVVFQSHFNQELTTRYFGEHNNSVVIHNGADTEYINQFSPLKNSFLDKFEDVWCCASSWRPHKRLSENVRYFLEHSGEKECLVVAGKQEEAIIKNERIIYVGEATIPQLISLYKRSKYFIHLAWLDHCPNVVVDAHAAGCRIVCSSSGGTKEIAGSDAIVVEEEEWDFKPTKLYEPPRLDFDKKIKNAWETDYNMSVVAGKYKNFLEGNIK